VTTFLAGLLAFVLAVAGVSLTAGSATAAPESATASSLNWGFKASWRSYIGFSGGTITASAGATKISPAPNAEYTWSAGATTYDPETKAGSAQFDGDVQFLHPSHVIDITLSDPRIVFTPEGTGSVYYTIDTPDQEPTEVLGATVGTVTVGAPQVSGATTTVQVDGTNLAFTDNNAAFTYTSATTPGPDDFSFTISYATPATPTTVALASSHTTIVAGGAVQLTATTSAGVAGSVEFFDGSTSLGSEAVASGAASHVVSGLSAGAHSFTAVFDPSSDDFSGSTSSAVAVTANAAPGAVTGNVSGAELEWALSPYALIGTAVPSSPLVASGSGFNFSASGGAEVVDPITRTGPGGGTTGTGFRLTGGTGSVDPSTGAGTITYPGSVTYAPYNYFSNSGDFTISGFRLSIAGSTGTLTALVASKNAPSAATLGPVQVTLATFAVASLTSDAGDFALTTAAPAYANTVPAGTYAGSFTNAWPQSFIAAIPSGFRAFFYQSGADGNSQGNQNKAPLPITASYTADAAATVTGVAVSQRTGLVAGDTVTVTATVSPAGAAGTIRLLLDGTAFASQAADGSPFVATTPVLSAGTHKVSAQFVPTNPVAYAASTSVAIPLTVAAPAITPPAGSFTWGIHGAFNDYVTGPIAQGSITASNGATRSGGVFSFVQTSGGDYKAAAGTGSVNYRGAVRYLGHHGALDQTLSNPVVRVESAGSATLLLTTGGSQVAFASLDLAAGTKSVGTDGAVRYSSVPVTLLSGGVPFFERYPAGTALSSASFVIGSASTAATPPAQTVTAPAAAAQAQPDATPPTADGIELTGDLVPGGTVTATADGFEADEEDILVVVYSEPVVLTRDLAADASGTATWTGRLPLSLEAGEHTLTFQGSVDRGASFVIEKTAAAAGVCTVDEASITWGFKESFRAYIDGSIANGEWTVADGASYETPNFTFTGGEGSYDAESSEGTIAFPGSIRFTGHDGALDTTVANPTITFLDDTTAVLALDVNGVTQGGETVARTGIEFVELDLSAATVTDEDGVVTIADAPAVLTEAGAEAFGTYPAGEAFDPVTMQFTTDASCAAVTPEPQEESPVAEEPASDAGSGLTWMWWVLGALALVAIIVAVVLIVRRRNAGA